MHVTCDHSLIHLVNNRFAGAALHTPFVTVWNHELARFKNEASRNGHTALRCSQLWRGAAEESGVPGSRQVQD